MTTSNVRHSDATKAGNVATPHAPVDGKVRPIAPFDSDNTNPAGGINSNADDMAKWLLVQLAEGTARRRLRARSSPRPRAQLAHARDADSDRRRARRSCATVRPNFNGYGLGLGVRDYRGHKLLTHTGGLPGLRVEGRDDPRRAARHRHPDQPGIDAAFEAIANHIIDAYLGAPTSDWIAAYQAIEKRGAAATASPRRPPTCRATQRRSRRCRCEKYAGKYRDAVVRRHDHRVRSATA